MIKKELKKLSVEVSVDCWKKLKILSITKELALNVLVREILEKSVAGKKFNVDIPELETN